MVWGIFKNGKASTPYGVLLLTFFFPIFQLAGVRNSVLLFSSFFFFLAWDIVRNNVLVLLFFFFCVDRCDQSILDRLE